MQLLLENLGQASLGVANKLATSLATPIRTFSYKIRLSPFSPNLACG